MSAEDNAAEVKKPWRLSLDSWAVVVALLAGCWFVPEFSNISLGKRRVRKIW